VRPLEFGSWDASKLDWPTLFCAAFSRIAEFGVALGKVELGKVELGIALVELGKPLGTNGEFAGGMLLGTPLLNELGSSFIRAGLTGGETGCSGKVVADIAPRCVSDIEVAVEAGEPEGFAMLLENGVKFCEPGFRGGKL